MKVAYFTESLPPNTDGVVKTLCHLINTLEDNKVDFRFYSPVKPDNSFTWNEHVYKVPAVPFFLYKDYKMGLPYFNGIFSKLDEYRPDMIHIVSPTLLGLYGLNYAHSRNIPVVTSYHTHFVSYFSYFGLSGLEKVGWNFLQWFHNRCLKTYVPSPSACQELETRGIQNVELWQRGIELDRFSPSLRNNELKSAIGVDEDCPVLLFVGRLINHKDLNDLVDAHHLLNAQGFKYKIVIVGDGPMRNELEQKLSQAHFTGYQYGQDLARWYASSDVFVFPSTTETFGNVILEAFASGIPAVGVAKGGVADIINHGRDGLIAKPNDPVDFAKQISYFLSHPDERYQYGRIARETAKTYSWKAINTRLLQSYENVIRASESVEFNPEMYN